LDLREAFSPTGIADSIGSQRIYSYRAACGYRDHRRSDRFTTPTLARSKGRAQSAVCRENLRQLGIGLQTFLSENHYYPVNNLNKKGALGPDSDLFWPGQLVREAFGILQPATDFNQNGVWRCPTARWADSMLRGGSPLSSYGCNDDKFKGSMLKTPDDMFGLQGHHDPDTDTFSPITESEVVAPGDMMAIGDSFEGDWLFMRRPIVEFQQWGNALSRQRRQRGFLRWPC
jgi:hypothetical protein